MGALLRTMPTFSTNIRVSNETYSYLDEEKADDESFDDVLPSELGVQENRW